MTAATRRVTDGRALGTVPGLDGVRGLAILLVVGLHVGILVSGRRGGYLPGGLIGVDLFFVLSGFLITSLLLDEHARAGRISLRKFYLRRACRLLPALFVFLAANAAYALATGAPPRTEAKMLVSILAYVGNWAQSFGLRFPTRLAHTWTLAVEEQFYLLWPVALIALVQFVRSRSMVVLTLCVAILASASLRAWLWCCGGGWPGAYMRTDARADALLIGALAAFLWRWDVLPSRATAWTATLSLAALLLFVPSWDATSAAMFYGGFTVAALACAALTVAVAEGKWKGTTLFENAALRALGRVSYGLYLWHVLCLVVVQEALPGRPRALQALVAVAASLIATALSWYLVERPFLRLKERWSPRLNREPARSGA